MSAATLARFVYLIGIWFWLGTVLLTTRGEVFVAVRLWTVSAAISGLAAAAQLALGNFIPATAPVWGRMSGLTQQVNDLGGLTAIAMVPALMFATQPNPNRRDLYWNAAVAGLVGAGLILSGSVGGFIAAIVGIAFWALWGNLGRSQLVKLGVVGLAGLVAVTLQSLRKGVTPWSRITTVLSANNPTASFYTRLQSDGAALSAVLRRPIFGAGLDSATAIKVTGNLVHNMFLGAWFGAGILGLIGIILVVVSVARAGAQVLKAATDERWRALILSMLASFITFLVVSMGEPILYQRFAWIPASMLLVVWAQRPASS
jgi:O-antigen ligase